MPSKLGQQALGRGCTRASTTMRRESGSFRLVAQSSDGLGLAFAEATGAWSPSASRVPLRESATSCGSGRLLAINSPADTCRGFALGCGGRPEFCTASSATSTEVGCGGRRLDAAVALAKSAARAEAALQTVEDVTPDLDRLVERVRPVGKDVVGMIVRGVADRREDFSRERLVPRSFATASTRIGPAYAPGNRRK